MPKKKNNIEEKTVDHRASGTTEDFPASASSSRSDTFFRDVVSFFISLSLRAWEHESVPFSVLKSD